MLSEKFNEILEERIGKIRSIVAEKGKEYAHDHDMLHNFKIAARIDNETPQKALWGMFKKHLVSIMDLVNLPYIPDKKLRDEKLGDAINYLILLEAIWEDREE